MPTKVSNLRPAVPLLVLSGLFVAAGGAVHLREWLHTYRHVPSSVPGAYVVRVGFVMNAATSALLAVALLAAVFAARRLAGGVIAAAALFELASLATLLQSRRGTVLRWRESGWSPGASQTRAIEIGALIVLAAAAAIVMRTRPVPDHREAAVAVGPALR